MTNLYLIQTQQNNKNGNEILTCPRNIKYKFSSLSECHKFNGMKPIKMTYVDYKHHSIVTDMQISK